ncbi:hypothetical protein, partial [Agrobacterium tumefaciens]|uniref:hypothetical protein n=1 Tax=Agrobacterium tumefaciens TaxID=358 RepID=UPI00287F3348
MSHNGAAAKVRNIQNRRVLDKMAMPEMLHKNGNQSHHGSTQKTERFIISIIAIQSQLLLQFCAAADRARYSSNRDATETPVNRHDTPVNPRDDVSTRRYRLINLTENHHVEARSPDPRQQ